MMKRLLLMAVLVSLTLQSVPAQEAATKALPSVVSLTVYKKDGSTQTGAGFLIVHDGVLATAAHLVRDAKRVTAKFPAGDEYECSGLIDKDDARNVALTRIKVFGRPLLTANPAAQTAGAKVFLAAIKEGAFGVIPMSVSEPASADGTVWAKLSGDLPLNTSGSPVLDEAGRVIGLFTLRKVEEVPVPFMIPVSFVLALDNTLPTQPWANLTGAVQPNTSPTPNPTAVPTPVPTGTPVTAPVNLDDIDALIGKGYLTLADNHRIVVWADVKIKGFGFLNGVPRDVYEYQQELDAIVAKLAEIRTDDPLRVPVLKALLQLTTLQKTATEHFIRGVVLGQQIQVWGAQSQDAHSRSTAAFTAIDAKIVETAPLLAALEKSSPKLQEFMVPELRYWLNLEKRRSGISLNTVVFVRRPMYFLVTYLDGLAFKIGFEGGDTVRSVGGKDFTQSLDVEDLKILIKENTGKKLDAVVERKGKLQNLKLKIPKEIPPNSLLK